MTLPPSWQTWQILPSPPAILDLQSPPSLSMPSADDRDHSTSGQNASKRSQMIGTVLAPAVRLWLRSQLDHADDLHVTIEADDRQLLSGSLDRVVVSATAAVYRGLHLSQAQVTGTAIQTNLGQVLRGKPLRLQKAFPIVVGVRLSQADMNASLRSPLLATAVIDFLLRLLGEDGDLESLQLRDPQVMLRPGEITLTASLVAASGQETPVVVRTGLQAQGSLLTLDRPQWLANATAQRGLPLKELHGFQFELGSHVSLEELTIAADHILCRGQLQVMPE